MSIDVPVLELFDLAGRVRAAAEQGSAAAARLRPVDSAGEIAAALDDAIDAFAVAARALAVETEDLGRAIDTVARSWLSLDGDLLERRGQVLAR